MLNGKATEGGNGGGGPAAAKRRPLKPRHAAFAVHCACTGNRAEAVRLADYTTAFPSRQAWVLMQEPEIRTAVEQARAVLAEVDAIIAVELAKLTAVDGDQLRLLHPPVVGTRNHNVVVICSPPPATERHLAIIGALLPFDSMIAWRGAWFCRTPAGPEEVLDAVLGGQVGTDEWWSVIRAGEFCFGGVPADLSDQLRTRRIRAVPVGKEQVPWDPDALRSVIEGQEL